MKIHIDGDACPVKEQVVKVAKELDIEVVLYIDVNHVYTKGDMEVVTVDQGPDSVDMAIVNGMDAGDVVVTNDYGLASMILGKRSYAINADGKEYTKDNIGLLLFQRHMHREIRKKNKRHKGPKKRDSRMNEAFVINFRKLLQRLAHQYD